MTKHSTRRIADGLGDVIRELGLGKKIRQYEAIDVWKDVVGESIAGVTEAEYIAGGKLFVRVARPTWRNELVYLKRELMEKLNTALGDEIVTDIIFK
jgi:predicted nucleic acid-binding Zn ribbon protein